VGESDPNRLTFSLADIYFDSIPSESDGVDDNNLH